MKNSPLNDYKLSTPTGSGVVVVKAETPTEAFKLLQEFEGEDPYLTSNKTEKDMILVPEVKHIVAYYAA